MKTVQQPETWVWTCLTALLITLRQDFGFVPTLVFDSFQYLSVAYNALNGHVASTSLVHFDAERSFGLVPAPMVTFPAGYSWAIAAVSRIGVSMEAASLLVSVVSTVACVPVLAWLSYQLIESRLLRNAVMIVFVFNANVIDYATCAISEPLFTFVVLCAVALLAAARDRAAAGWRWAAAGLMFGAAYFVRYAGLFFVVALALLSFRYAIAGNRQIAKRYAVAVAAASALVLIGVARNILLVGTWRGGNEKIVSNPLASVVVESIRAANELFLGPGSALHGGTLFPRLLFSVLLIAAMTGLTWNYFRSQREFNDRIRVRGTAIDIAVLVVVYTGCMFYAGLTTVISYGVRMFYPLTPLLILALGVVLDVLLRAPLPSIALRRLTVSCLAACLTLYLFLNFQVVRFPRFAEAALVAELLNARAANGDTAREAALNLAGEDGVIMASNGQAVGYLLARPTVSLVGPQYSKFEWTEEMMRNTARAFGAVAIIISVPNEGGDDDSFVPSAFIRKLAQGEWPPWMRLVHRSRGFRIYAPATTARNQSTAAW